VSDRPLVVADTGPLISLAKVDAVGCLFHLFSTVTIPPAVARELEQSRFEVARGLLTRFPGFTCRAPGAPPDVMLVAALDPGESEAIALAIELGQPLLIDERRGRRFATAIYGLRVRGTIGVLVEARAAGLVGPLAPLFARLVAGGDRFGAELIEEALRKVGER